MKGVKFEKAGCCLRFAGPWIVCPAHVVCLRWGIDRHGEPATSIHLANGEVHFVPEALETVAAKLGFEVTE